VSAFEFVADGPTTLAGLAPWLETSPWVVCLRDDSPPQLRCFARLERGGFWFHGPGQRQAVFLPIDCGMTASESAFTFLPDRFRVEKFGRRFDFLYVALRGPDVHSLLGGACPACGDLDGCHLPRQILTAAAARAADTTERSLA
jgi:hypothetical protein